VCLHFSVCFALSNSAEDLTGTLEEHIHEITEKGYEIRIRQCDCEASCSRESCQKVDLSLHICFLSLELIVVTAFLLD